MSLEKKRKVAGFFGGETSQEQKRVSASNRKVKTGGLNVGRFWGNRSPIWWVDFICITLTIIGIAFLIFNMDKVYAFLFDLILSVLSIVGVLAVIAIIVLIISLIFRRRRRRYL